MIVYWLVHVCELIVHVCVLIFHVCVLIVYWGGAGQVRMVKTLLRIYPQAAAEVDMDGLLPIHFALRNSNKAGSQEAVRLLLHAYPDSVLPEPFAPGGLGLDYTWTQVRRR